jgi:competence protein CoiA
MTVKYALMNGQREEAKPGLSGECPGCNRPMIAKCGELKAHHWAHAGKRVCDSWHENETEWHRAWKNQFPAEWQEIVHHADDGERHIADVKTDKAWVLEFQHSHLKPDERRARTNFYKKLVWVVDGDRRQRYKVQFLKEKDKIVHVSMDPPIRKVHLESCSLLKEWINTQAPVFFDFGEELPLWCIVPGKPEAFVHVAAIERHEFISLLRDGAFNAFEELVMKLVNIVSIHKIRHAPRTTQVAPQPRTTIPQRPFRPPTILSRNRFRF